MMRKNSSEVNIVEKRNKKLENPTPGTEGPEIREGRPSGSPSPETAAAPCEGPPAEEVPPAGPQPDAPENAAERIGELENELAEMKDRFLRLMAEFDNFRKRTAKERESFYLMAKSDTIGKLLPVYDNIERAVNNPTQDEAYKKGVEMIFQQLKDIFAELGVVEIEAENRKFDPEKHNAVMHVEDEKYEENTVIEVLQRGFEIDGRVIRHAVVKVAN
jgi:molecular chaperone GrpE